MTYYLVVLHAGSHGTPTAAYAVTLGLTVVAVVVAVVADRRRPEPPPTQPPPRTETTR
jgi:hypothetical protein